MKRKKVRGVRVDVNGEVKLVCKFFFWGGGGGGGSGWMGTENCSFCEIKKKLFFFGGGGGGGFGGHRVGGQGGCERRSKVFVRIPNQRTNGPVNAHLIPWPSKAQNIQTWKIYDKEMTLTFNTHIPL